MSTLANLVDFGVRACWNESGCWYGIILQWKL